MTKFFPDSLFLDKYFSPIFLTWQEFIPIFFSILILILFIISYLFAKFMITMFFLRTLSWLSKAVLTKILKCKWKQGIKKNNNNDINRTRNRAFINFKNYATLKTSKKIGFKLVLTISRSKEWVFNSFKDLVWFFNHWFKAIQNQITASSQVLIHLIDPFSM